jgi:uncharacterized protein YciI
MSRILIALAGIGLALSAGPAAAQPPARPAFPPDVAAQIPPNLRGYFLAFLVGPAESGPLPHDVFIGHLRYIRREIEAGVYHLVGPFTDQGRIKGIIVLSAASIEEARAIVAADPSVQAHLLDVEVHPALFPDLSSLRIEFPPAAH